MSPQDNLHAEAKIIPIERHKHMLSSQYILNHELHPFHRIVAQENRPVTSEKVLHQQTSSFLNTDELSHRHIANSYNPNKVPETQPPPMYTSEKGLLRDYITTVSQLRSGYSCFTNQYMSRISPDTPNICPECVLLLTT